jgi:hypothetical protein
MIKLRDPPLSGLVNRGGSCVDAADPGMTQ